MVQYQAVEAFRGGKNLIKIVGHRGARGLYPENSMMGFEATINDGTTLLEFDVGFTADGVPVITHDHHLHTATFRGPDGKFIKSRIKVCDLTSAELLNYQIGYLDRTSAYGKRFPNRVQIEGERVPRLLDLLTLAAKPGHESVYLLLEIKSDPDFRADTTYRTNMIDKIIKDVRKSGLSKRTLLHSFDWDLLADCQKVAPDIPNSYLSKLPNDKKLSKNDPTVLVAPNFEGQKHRIVELVSERGGGLWCPYVKDVTARDVNRAKELGLVIAVWTVNSIKDINDMIKLGVDAIVTDYPDRVQRQLLDKGYIWRTPV